MTAIRRTGGAPKVRIPAGNRLTCYRAARSAFPAVVLDFAGPSRESGKTGPERRDSRARALSLREVLDGPPRPHSREAIHVVWSPLLRQPIGLRAALLLGGYADQSLLLPRGFSTSFSFPCCSWKPSQHAATSFGFPRWSTSYHQSRRPSACPRGRFASIALPLGVPQASSCVLSLWSWFSLLSLRC